MSKLSEQIAGVCDDVLSNDSHVHFMPQAGKLMTLIKILNEEGIAYHFQRSKQEEEF